QSYGARKVKRTQKLTRPSSFPEARLRREFGGQLNDASTVDACVDQIRAKLEEMGSLPAGVLA
ncbi:MAG: hypothetical protein AAF152_21465, partial [Cyanobacteria bacterium P01_A01_bin.114]